MGLNTTSLGMMNGMCVCAFFSSQLKTERERVAERMIRLGKKWEAEHQQWEERERQQEAEMKVKEMELLASDKKCLGKLEKGSSGGGGERADKSPRKGEMNMDNFLKKERQLMLTRLKPKDKKFVPFTKDLRVVDAKLVFGIYFECIISVY